MKKISELTALTGADDADLLVIVDVDEPSLGDRTKNITVAEIFDRPPSAHASSHYSFGNDPLSIASLGGAPSSHVGAGGAEHANVVAAGAAGFMTGADKTKLDGIATGATVGPSLASTTPADIGSPSAIGVGTTAARADHVHAHGNQAGGALHAAATITTAGFMPAFEKDQMFESTQGVILFDDFHVGLTNTLFTALPAGAGSGVAQIASEDSHQGIVRATTGTTTTGSALIMRTQVLNAIKLGGGLFEVLSYFRINQLSTVGEEFDFQIGLDNANATPDSTGCYLSYRRLVRGTTFYGYGFNGSFHSQNTGVTVTAGQWVQHRMTIDSGLTVRHYIGVAGATPTLVATLAASAPSALNSLTAKLIKTAGTTPVTVDYDFVGVREVYTVAR